MEGRRFCPSCGEDVVVYEVEVERGRQRGREVRCAYCGFSLDWVPPTSLAREGTLIIADDTATLAELLKDYFQGRALFDRIVVARHGGQFLEAAVRCFQNQQAIRLAIVDVRMPVLTGTQAAVAFRWIEQAFGRTSRAPIIFLSALRIDENLQRVMEYCAPAHYVNKSTEGPPEALLDRLYQVAVHLMSQPATEVRPL
jgi:CheY-like chemotaxis protein/DNA-directed RNA polymerase subunit RPC12/RpoP